MPDWKDEITRRLRSLKLAPAREAAIVEEVAQHLEDRYQELVAGGATEEEARRMALKELSEEDLLARGLRRVEQEVPQEPVVLGAEGKSNFFATVWQALRFGLRMLRKNPAFTVAAVVTLALGIGGATAIFNATDQALLSPLPLPEPQQLAAVYNFDKKAARYVSSSYPDYEDFSQRSRSFQHLSAYVRLPLNLSIGDRTEGASVEAVSTNYFTMLELPPLTGRAFTRDDGESSSAQLVAMVGEDLCRKRFGGDPNLLGKTITIAKHAFLVIGVVLKRYRGANLNWGDPPQVWIPLSTVPLLLPRIGEVDIFHRRAARWMVLLGRLKPGVTVSQAEAELRLIAAELAQAEPATNRDITVAAFSASRSKFWPAYRDSITQSFLVFSVGAGLVLLLACANVSNLLLERAFARRREIAIRIALGAARGRLVRQLMAENLLLVITSFSLALVVAYALDGVLARFPNAFGIPLALDLGLGSRMLFFSFLLSLTTILLSGLAPALQASQPDIIPFLKESGNAPLQGPSGDWLQRSLVVVQVAFSMVLLVVGGIFTRSVLKAYSVDLGFRPDHLLIMGFEAPREHHDDARSQVFSQAALREISSIAGVETATVAWDVPLTMHSTMSVADASSRSPEEIEAAYNMVGPDYFRTLGITILAGREFTWGDGPNSAKAVIVNQTLAQRLWHGSNAVGRSILVNDQPGHRVLVEVVGLTRDSKYVSIWENAEPYMYFAAWQWEFPAVNLIARTRGEPLGLVHEIQHEWRGAFPGVVLYGIHTGKEHVRVSIAPQRLAAGLLGSFAVIAALVASVGLYGVVAFSVSRRRREIGIRMAIGAKPATVARGILGSALWLTALGLVLGAAGACVMMRFIASQVRGVSPYDGLTFIGVAFLLFATSAGAAFIPALRAASLDPLVTLRSE